MAIRVTPSQLPRELKARAQQLPRVIQAGLFEGALRGQTHLVRRSPKDRGIFKASWKVRRRGDDVVLENSAPYAGIIEFGARPHPVSREGVQSIYGWVLRTIAGDRREAKRITGAIVNKIRRHGQAPTYLVRDSVDELRGFARTAVEHQIERQSSKPARGR